MALSICSVVRLRTSRRFVPARIALCRSAMRRSEEHTSELQSPCNLVCRLLLEKKKLNSLEAPKGTITHPLFGARLSLSHRFCSRKRQTPLQLSSPTTSLPGPPPLPLGWRISRL